MMWFARMLLAVSCSSSRSSGFIRRSVESASEVFPYWKMLSHVGGSRPTSLPFTASTYVPDAPHIYIVLRSPNFMPACSRSVKWPALMAPMAFIASEMSLLVMNTPSCRCILPSSVVSLPFFQRSLSLATATAAMTPVPVMPTALPCIGPSSDMTPRLKSNLSPFRGMRSSSRTLHIHWKSYSRSLMAPGAASMPHSMDCPSMAGPAAADPVYMSSPTFSAISALVP